MQGHARGGSVEERRIPRDRRLEQPVLGQIAASYCPRGEFNAPRKNGAHQAPDGRTAGGAKRAQSHGGAFGLLPHTVHDVM